MSNENLHKAKKAKNDEFYTRYEDVKSELDNYKEKFKDKIILCNCNDKGSAFERYFTENDLGIKELIVTEGRFQDNLEALERCDIVATNPPFSQFREFINLLVEYDKDFIVIGSKNAITYKDFFIFLKEEKVKIGYSRVNFFSNTRSEVPCYWYTTFDTKREKINLTSEYSEKKYKRFDNFNAINVDKTKDIPKDYTGYMGVPVSFLNKWNRDQFEIIDGMNRYAIIDFFKINKKLRKEKKHATQVSGETKYFRVIIKRIEVDSDE